MTARDGRVSRSRQVGMLRLSRMEKKGFRERETGVGHVTSNGAARSTSLVSPRASDSFKFGG